LATRIQPSAFKDSVQNQSKISSSNICSNLYSKAERKSDQSQVCFKCDKLIINCDCSDFIQCSYNKREHEYETIDFDFGIVEEKEQEQPVKKRTPKSKKEPRRPLTRNRKQRVTPKSKPKKYGTIKREKIKSITTSYYKVLPNQPNTAASHGNQLRASGSSDSSIDSKCKVSALENTRAFLRQKISREDPSSGYSSRSSSVSSISTSSIQSLLAENSKANSNYPSVYSQRPAAQKLNVPGQRTGFILAGDEELWIPEQKDLIPDSREFNSQNSNIASTSDINQDNHQHQNNQNIEISNEVIRTICFNEVHNIYSFYQVNNCTIKPIFFNQSNTFINSHDISIN